MPKKGFEVNLFNKRRGPLNPDGARSIGLIVLSRAQLRYTRDGYLYQFHILHHMTCPVLRGDPRSRVIAESRSPAVRFISR